MTLNVKQDCGDEMQSIHVFVINEMFNWKPRDRMLKSDLHPECLLGLWQLLLSKVQMIIMAI